MRGNMIRGKTAQLMSSTESEAITNVIVLKCLEDLESSLSELSLFLAGSKNLQRIWNCDEVVCQNKTRGGIPCHTSGDQGGERERVVLEYRLQDVQRSNRLDRSWHFV